MPLRARGRKSKGIPGRNRGLEQLVLGGGLESGRAVGHARAHKHKDQAGEDRAQREAKSSSRQDRSARARCRAIGLAAAHALRMRKETVDLNAGLATSIPSQLRHLGLALSSARAQGAILLRACDRTAIRAKSVARTRTAALPRPARLLPRRGPGPLLRALRIATCGTSGRRRGASRRRCSAASKTNALLPLITVVVSVCHSHRLASYITCLSYKKDVQQMGACAKSSVNGTKGSKCTGVKAAFIAPGEHPLTERATTTSGIPRRSSQNRRHSYASSAFGRAMSGSAAPRPYCKATK